jgi:predicted MFS family arabinose efflux permease
LNDAAIRTAPAAPATSQRRLLVMLACGAFCSTATVRVADPLLPQVAEEFHVGPASASIIATAFALSYGLCQIAYGPLGDRLGKVRVIAVTLLLASLAVALCAAASSLWMLGALRFVAGGLAAAVIPLSFAHIGDAVPYEERQATLARFLTGQILGVVFGQVFGGILGEVLGWRQIFLVLGAAYLVIGLLLLAQWNAARPAAAGAHGRNPLAAYLMVARTPWARLVTRAVFFEGLLFFGGLAYVGASLRDRFGLSYVAIGIVLGFFGIGGIAYTLSVRPILRRLGEKGMAVTGGAGLAVCFLVIGASPVWWGPAPALIGIGFFFYMLHNTLQTHATQMVPSARGSALAFFAFFFFIGQSLGVAGCGAAIERIGYLPTFAAVGLGLLLLGAWFRRQLERRSTAAAAAISH